MAEVWNLRISYNFLCLAITVLYCHGLEIDHWGNHFVASFLQNRLVKVNTNIIVLTAREKTDAVITFHETGQITNVALEAGKTKNIQLPESATAKPFQIVLAKKAVSVTSTAKISVYGFVESPKYSDDGFLVFPVDGLGTEYIAVNYDLNSQIAVIAVEDDTHVTIQFKGNNTCGQGNDYTLPSIVITDGHTFTFDMDQHDVVNILCDSDSSGSKVIANKQVAVLSGNTCARVPSTSLRDHLNEMLPPISEFGVEFVVPSPCCHSYAGMVRVVAAFDNTIVTIEGSTETLHSQNYISKNLAKDEKVCITSDKGVLVVLYMTGKLTASRDGVSNRYGDPFMMVIPPTNKYTTEYILDTDVFNSLIHTKQYITVISKISTIGSITPSISGYVEKCGYAIKTLLVNGTVNYSSSSPFLLLQYSFGMKVGSGYPGGMKLTQYQAMDTTIADDTTTSKLNLNAWSTSFYTTTAQLLKTTGSEITTHGLQTTVTGTMLFSYETSEIGDTTLTGETTVMDETTVLDDITVIDGTTLTAVMDRTTPSDKTTLTDDNIQIGDTTVIYQTTVKSQITVTDDTPVIGETDATQKTILADESTVTDDTTTTVSMIVTDDTFMTPHTETPAEDDESTEILHSPEQTTEDGLGLELTSLMNTHENNTDTMLEITTENQIFPETTVAAKTTHKLKISTEKIITETPLTDKPAPIRWLRQCGCPCAKKKSILTIESARKIPRELVVKKQNLSKSKRKKISAENTHKSEVDLGKFSIFIFVVVSCVIMFPDISNLLMTIWKWFNVRVTVKKSIIA